MKLLMPILASTLLVGLAGCSSSESEAQQSAPKATDKVSVKTEKPVIHPEIWPKQASPIKRDPKMEADIKALMAKMTVEEKVGQIIQADIGSITPAQVKEYNLGSILNGGNSAPGGDNRTTPDAWVALADEFWIASTDTSDGGVGIPALWGTDAVHGHNNIVGATIFPHNIGLGAANDPKLMREIGRVTAKELLITGLDWTFAPTIAVVRDDRWGRTYESYSEDPKIVADYAGYLVEGIQGTVNTPSFLGDDHLIATAKHFIGDGGTVGGRDQGDNITSEEELRDIQGAGYPPAIKAGVQVVMASFNSWHGKKMHGHEPLLSDVLVDQMGLDGFVVGDWNGHGQVKGCTNISCAQSINAGLDMFMAPDSWEKLYHNTLAQVKAGEITSERLDEAVARVLRVKKRAGLFDAGLPSKRLHSGKYNLLGSAEHRAVARRAVRESLVLIKNNNKTLPLSPKQHILMAGDGADNIGKQSGGWTLSWQGRGNKNSDFPNADSIYGGFKKAAEAAGGKVTLSETGEYTKKPDVAVVVFGEDPYAEFQGDRPHVDFESEDGLALLKKFKSEGIPTVAIFLTGRAMWMNTEFNQSDAFVAAWLPGSEGAGVADVLLSKADGSVNHDFRGKLSFSWPKLATQTAVNVGDKEYDPLFPYGYGLTYADNKTVDVLPEESGLAGLASSQTQNYFESGATVSPWRLVLRDSAGELQVTTQNAVSASQALTVSALDYQAQEDSRVLNFTGKASASIEGEPIDIERESNGDMAIEIHYNVLSKSVTSATLGMECGYGCGSELNIASQLNEKAGKGWQTAQIKLSCFAKTGTDMTKINKPLVLASEGGLKIQLQYAKLVSNQGAASCKF